MKLASPIALCLGAVVFVVGSCEDEKSPTPPVPDEPVRETYLIRDVDYVNNTYFSFNHAEGFLGAADTAPIDVYRQLRPEDLIRDPTIIRKPAVAIPDPANDGQALADAVAQIAAGYTPLAFEGDFMLLQRGVDYDFIWNGYAITGVALYEPLPDVAQKTLAVRYKNTSDVDIGGSYSSRAIGARGGAGPDTGRRAEQCGGT